MAESKTRGFGDRLRRAREESGRDIKALAETTRIQSRYLQALEEEDWSVVPRGVIGRGFVRVIARELGVPAGELLQLYRAARGEEDAEPERSLPEVDWKVDLVSERRRRPAVVVVLAVLVLVALAVSLWAVRRPDRENAAPSEAADSVPLPAAPSPAPRETPAVLPASPSAAAPQVPNTPPAVAEPSAHPPQVTASALRLEVEARDRVWLRVSADGGQGQERVLKPGERAHYEAGKGFQIKIGNAGSVTLYWNGEALRPVGKTSQVVSLSLPEDLASLQP